MPGRVLALQEAGACALRESWITARLPSPPYGAYSEAQCGQESLIQPGLAGIVG
jgi:hypothetical protein